MLERYLDDRQQFIEMNGARSCMRHVSYVVPQGSLLAPRLFSMYITNLPDNFTNSNIFLLVDETKFYYIGQNSEEVVDKLNEIRVQIKHWCEKNQLTIHVMNLK